MAAALAAAVPLLTGCNTTHAGAAAVVDGDRITIAKLNTEVEQVVDARASVPAEGTAPIPREQLANQQLMVLLQDRVIDEAARRAGLTVTATEIAEARHELEAQNDGPEGLKRAAAAGGIAPERMDTYLRNRILQVKLLQSRGVKVTSEEAAEQALDGILREAAAGMKIKINPRYEAQPDYSWLKAKPQGPSFS
jgi:hypothetical protein